MKMFRTNDTISTEALIGQLYGAHITPSLDVILKIKKIKGRQYLNISVAKNNKVKK